jgi:outer membrane protein assembly factor BamB
MKLLKALMILLFINACSFDNKTGIWIDENKIPKETVEVFKDFEIISSSSETFNKTILHNNKQFPISLGVLKNNNKWNDIYFNKNNNFENFTYKNLKKEIIKSKKLTKYELNKYVLFENNNLITSDVNGNLIIFNQINNKNIKFNFYKGEYKKIKKILNLYVEKNIIYVSDNLGYLYAYNYRLNKVLWAKNYKIPFRSNLKVSKNDLIAANQNNNLYFFDKKSGEILRTVPTEETSVKNKFVNNLSLSNDSLFYLNTYGSLYSFDLETKKINWFINLNKSLELNPSNLFLGNQIINNNKKIIVSSNNKVYVIDAATGSTSYVKNFSSITKPILSNNFLFLISKNNLLIAIELSSGRIAYSYDINERISKFLKIKKKNVSFRELMLVNDNIFIFLKNSYILNFKKEGELQEVFKLPSKILTNPIFIDGSLLFLNTKKKLIILN